MKIMVTGGAGFIGSHLCDRLLAQQHSLEVVDDLSLGREDNISHLFSNPAFRFHNCSILDERFDEIMAAGSFDVVFHLAANSDIQEGSRDRRVDLQRTFQTTFAVCEAMARNDVRQLLFASTSAVYGDVSAPAPEDFGPLEPISFYGAAKLASEAYCSAYAHRHDIRSWVFRFPNVVGARATHGVILDFIRKLKNNSSELQVLGDGNQQKPYLHVHELIDAKLLAWQRVQPRPLEVFNIGPESATTVRCIAETVVEEMGLAGKTRISYQNQPFGWPGDVPRFAYDLRKIHALGWRARGSSDNAMRRAVRDLLAESEV